MFTEIKGGGVTAPLGFMASVANSDIKGKGADRKDTAVIISDEPCTVGAVFTKNVVKAAPVIFDREVLKANTDKIFAIIVNSGNANACTGQAGIEVCKETVIAGANAFDIPQNSILVASTGVIGVKLPVERLVAKIPTLAETASDEQGHEFAKAIMTTDTEPKECAVLAESDKGNYVIGGCCKGAGMISPSLATMLTFITTDAKISPSLLQKALDRVAEDTFNCVTVDGDMSTNDSVFLLANGMSNVKIDDNNLDGFIEALKHVCLTLAKKIAKDGEGATKLVTITVKGAKNRAEARLCASTIANSPLVKTMFAGCDPNWGRLMSSAGSAGIEFDPNKTDIFFDNLHYVQNGIIIDASLETVINKIMKKDEYEIIIDFHDGDGEISYYTCDFTTDYVKINADYRS